MAKGNFSFEVVDERPTAFYSQTPHPLVRNPKISDKALRVYNGLDSFRNRKTGECKPGLRILSESCAVHFTRIPACLKNLESNGAIKIERRPGRPHIYRLLPVRTVPGGGTDCSRLWNTAVPGHGTPITEPDQENQKKEPEGRSAAPPSEDSFGKKLQGLVRDWFDSFSEIKKRKSGTPGSVIAARLRKKLSDHGEAKVRAIMGEYWDGVERGRGNGSIYDFDSKFDMLYDICKKRGDTPWQE